MLSLRTNNPSNIGLKALSLTSKAQPTSVTRLSTGYQINSAMDDAAGPQINTSTAPPEFPEQP